MEFNSVEKRVVPVKPKVLQNEQIEVYVPVANYKYPGLASFDPNGFIIDQNGNVKLRRSSIRNVSTFTIDESTGICTIYYDDGTVSKVNIPITTDGLYNRNNLISEIIITPESFVLDGNGHWVAIFPSSVTGFENDKFLASLELVGEEYNLDNLIKGHYTVVDTLFKGEDGSILISVDTVNDRESFYGRLLLLGGTIFTDNQVVSITYNQSSNEIQILKADGSIKTINVVNEDFVKNYVSLKMARVYTAKGNISYENLPTLEELATGKYLGFVYNVTNSFTADIRFETGAYGKEFKAGTNVAVAQRDDGTYEFDVFSTGESGGVVDLTEYVKFTDYATVSKAGAVRINNASGIRIDSSGALYLDTANDSEIVNQEGNTAIKVYQTPQAVKSGLLKHDNVEWTDDDKAKACETIGAVKEVIPLSGIEMLYANNGGQKSFNLGTDGILGFAGNSPQSLKYSQDIVNDSIVQRQGTNILVPYTPTYQNSAICKQYAYDTFLPKVTGLSQRNQAYVKTSAGNNETFDIDSEATANTIVRRRNDGTIFVPTNTSLSNAAISKYQADNSFVAKPANNGVVHFNAADGTSSTYGTYQNIPGSQQIPIAKTGGRITTNTPEEDLDCANKKYVDDAVANAGGGKLYMHVVEGTFDDTVFTMETDVKFSFNFLSGKNLDLSDVTKLKNFVVENGNKLEFCYYRQGDISVTKTPLGRFFGHTEVDNNWQSILEMAIYNNTLTLTTYFTESGLNANIKSVTKHTIKEV